MKGYAINNVLYVFPQTADQIPYVSEGTTIIYVQQEDLAAWKEENTDYADIMLPYNYNVMTVQPKVWSEHLDDDIEAPYVPVSPELAWSAESATVTINADDNVFPTLTNPNSVTVSYISSASNVANFDENGDVELYEAGQCDMTASFAGDETYAAQAVTYTLTVNPAPIVNVVITGAEYLSAFPEGSHVEVGETGTITVSDNNPTATVSGFYYPGDDDQQTAVDISFTQDSLDYSWTQPDATVYITVSYENQ